MGLEDGIIILENRHQGSCKHKEQADCLHICVHEMQSEHVSVISIWHLFFCVCKYLFVVKNIMTNKQTKIFFFPQTLKQTRTSTLIRTCSEVGDVFRSRKLTLFFF